MSITYSLHLIDPGTYETIVKDLTTRDLREFGDVESLLTEYHVSDGKRLTLLDGLRDEFSPNISNRSRFDFNQLFSALVTEQEWDLGKCFGDHALSRPLLAFPKLNPMRRLFCNYEGWDIEIPEEFSADDAGLFGIWSASKLGEANEVVRQFQTEDDAMSYANSIQWSLFDRLLRPPRQATRAISTWIGYWDCWQDIRTAITTTIKQNKALGFSMI